TYSTSRYENLFREGLDKIQKVKDEDEDVSEVFALLSSSWGNELHQVILIVKEKEASVEYRENRESGLSEWKKEVILNEKKDEFIKYMKMNKIDSLKNYYSDVLDGIEY